MYLRRRSAAGDDCLEFLKDELNFGAGANACEEIDDVAVMLTMGDEDLCRTRLRGLLAEYNNTAIVDRVRKSYDLRRLGGVGFTSIVMTRTFPSAIVMVSGMPVRFLGFLVSKSTSQPSRLLSFPIYVPS